MRYLRVFPLFLILIFSSCFEKGTAVLPEETSEEVGSKPIDYSSGHAMNQKLGRGINLGNAYDSECFNRCRSSLEPECTEIYHKEEWDACWSNPIKEEYYQIIKDAGFNSIRLPARWGEKAPNTPPYKIIPSYMEQVKAEVELAISYGFPVVLNVHHYNELYGDREYTSETNRVVQLEKLVEIWKQISLEFKDFPDDMLVLEILNEPRSPMNIVELNQLFADVWPIIREHNPNKTIMINPMDWGAYTAIKNVILPEDGNVIASGHIYDPHEFTHQGTGNYPVGVSWGNRGDVNELKYLFKKNLDDITTNFPGMDGGTIPINIGEFGVRNVAEISERALYTATIREEAEKYNMSWHYWAFTGVSFDAWNRNTQEWTPEILEALISK